MKVLESEAWNKGWPTFVSHNWWIMKRDIPLWIAVSHVCRGFAPAEKKVGKLQGADTLEMTSTRAFGQVSRVFNGPKASTDDKSR